jgi:MoxR-like ATPase
MHWLQEAVGILFRRLLLWNHTQYIYVTSLRNIQLNFRPGRIMDDVTLLNELNERISDVRSRIATIIVGQDDIVDQLFVGLLSGGHCLLVGVPGLAKTLMVRTFAQTLDLRFGRIQFTPDLMPSDITGTEVLDDDPTTGHKQFRFVEGPVFTNVLLADEINRAPPRTQSALLEAMQEHNVTASGRTLPLPDPFYVLATQNPIEQEGTYPLPEAQLDRFMLMLWVDYPSDDEEQQIVHMTTSEAQSPIESALTPDDISAAQQLVRRMPVDQRVVSQAVKLVRQTRPTSDDAPEYIRNWVSWGAGPRASQYLVLASKARAMLDGRKTPSLDDIKALAVPILRHRIITNFNAEADSVSTTHIIEKLLRDLQ